MEQNKKNELNKQLSSVASELKDVQKALKAYKQRKRHNESANAEAFVFIEKADKVIQRAENGEIILTEEQKKRIKSNLVKILNSLKNLKR